MFVWRNRRQWRIGSDVEVEWIDKFTSTGLAITSAIPPVFEAYATIVVPEDPDERSEDALAVLEVLRERSARQPWWLGYLDTGVADVVFPDAPRVTLYAGWEYVLVEAGPHEAGQWRADSFPRGPLPDLFYPADRSWLLSRLWDDDWWCFGGPASLVNRLVEVRRLEARRVGLSEDATPPGHVAR